ncbi:MAG: GFA family protein [Chloroflexota bacterium]
MPNSKGRTYSGRCDCGSVRYVTTSELRPVVNCHCGQCRRTSGHFVAATAAKRDTLEITESLGLTWYKSSDFARRGFCRYCGSSLFWERTQPESEMISIMAGTLDTPTGLSTALNIFVEDAGDYYAMDERIPQGPNSDAIG